MHWDPQIATYQAVTAYGLPGMGSSNFGTSQTPLGNLSFSWNDAQLLGVTVPDSSVLFAVAFTLVGAPGSSTNVNFTSSPVMMEITNVDFNVVYDSLVPGHILILDSTTQAVNGPLAWSGVAYPNPLSLAAPELRVKLPSGAEATEIEWINALGQKLAGDISNGQAGETITCKLPSGLVPGLWTLRVTTSDGPLDYRIVVDRH